MTVIRPNSISGVSSITGNGGDISIFRADGTAADVTVNNITSGVITATTFSGNVTGNVTGAVTGSGANLTNLPAAQLTGALPAISAANLTGIPAANITGALPSISAANLTNIPAGNLTGIVTSARLGGGTASNSTFLRGDGTFAEAGGGIILQEIHATQGSQVEVTSSTYTDTGLSASITTTGSNKVLIFVAQSLEARQYNATGFAVCGLRLIRTTSGSDSVLYYGNRACVTSGPGSGSYFVASGCVASIVQEDSPGAGTHTYKTVVNRSVGGSGTAARANSDGTASRMILMEVAV